MTAPSPIAASMDLYLRTEQQFLRKGSTWYRKLDDLIWVVNLQKSQYGRQYYVNIGVWLRELGDLEWPKEQECHVRSRIEALADPMDEPRIKERFDLESSLEEPDRTALIIETLSTLLGPVLDRVRSIEDMRGPVGKAFLTRSLVRGVAQPLLSPK
jgi:hypothetical protein